jgi:uncharacterized protein YndB with AHSA1/START domain
MVNDAIRLSRRLDAPPERLYEAFMDSDLHSEFTGGEASVDPRVGGAFTAWDGYIEGTTLELEPGARIVQAWRAEEFPEDAPDSRLEVLFERDGDGTLLTLLHTEVPPGMGPTYEKGWVDYYLDPLERWLADS